MDYAKLIFHNVIVCFAFSSIALGQNPVQFGFGLRAGLLGDSVFQANRLCSGVGCSFGTSSFAATNSPATMGVFGRILLHDAVEVRAEAVRQRFGYQVRYDLDRGDFEQHAVTSTRGHFWDFPLLATYSFSPRTVRPFAGGG